MNRKLNLFFRIVVIVFMVVEIINCFIRGFATGDSFYKFFEITNGLFWAVIYYGLYYFCSANEIKKSPFLILSIISILSLLIDIVIMFIHDNAILFALGMVIFVADYIFTTMAAVNLFHFKKSRFTKQVALLFIFQVNITLVSDLIFIFLKGYITNPDNIMLVVNGTMIISTLVELYLLFCVQKLFVTKEDYEQDYDSEEDNDIEDFEFNPELEDEKQ